MNMFFVLLLSVFAVASGEIPDDAARWRALCTSGKGEGDAQVFKAPIEREDRQDCLILISGCDERCYSTLVLVAGEGGPVTAMSGLRATAPGEKTRRLQDVRSRLSVDDVDDDGVFEIRYVVTRAPFDGAPSEVTWTYRVEAGGLVEDAPVKVGGGQAAFDYQALKGAGQAVSGSAAAQGGGSAATLAAPASPDARAIDPEELLAFEQRDGRWGLRDGAGHVLVAATFERALGLGSKHVAAVWREGAWWVVDRRGASLFRTPSLDNGPDPFSSGLARFIQRGKTGFYDSEGRIVIPARFDHATPFSGQRAKACEGCRPVSDGEHTLIQGGEWFVIDREGRKVE
jgi:hypothetical protein